MALCCVVESDAGRDQLPANARLIAKAPEMREALQFIFDACVRLNDSEAVMNGNKDMLCEELNDIQTNAGRLLAEIDG